jgi:hypothetical protein
VFVGFIPVAAKRLDAEKLRYAVADFGSARSSYLNFFRTLESSPNKHNPLPHQLDVFVDALPVAANILHPKLLKAFADFCLACSPPLNFFRAFRVAPANINLPKSMCVLMHLLSPRIHSHGKSPRKWDRDVDRPSKYFARPRRANKLEIPHQVGVSVDASCGLLVTKSLQTLLSPVASFFPGCHQASFCTFGPPEATKNSSETLLTRVRGLHVSL